MTESLPSEARPVHNQEILCQEMGEEMLLYPLEGKAIHVLNRTALAIWELCDGEHSIDQIEQEIRERFAMSDPQPDIATDVRNTLQQLIEKALVHIAMEQSV